MNLTNILLDGWEGLKAFTFEKKQSKAAHFEFSAAKLLHIFSRRASRGTAWPLHVKFASYTPMQYSTRLHACLHCFPVNSSYALIPSTNPTQTETQPYSSKLGATVGIAHSIASCKLLCGCSGIRYYLLLQASGSPLPPLALDLLPVTTSPSLPLTATRQCSLEGDKQNVTESMTATSWILS